jgi:hypothetical protein
MLFLNSEQHLGYCTPLPKGGRLVICKWVSRIKYELDGIVERHKDQLVFKGFFQVEGIDYN